MKKMRIGWKLLALCFLAAVSAAHAEDGVRLLRGSTVYVPVYSHIYIGDQARPFLLAATMSVRNSSPTEPLVLLSVSYYDSDGTLLQKRLKEPQTIKPLASVRFLVAESDKEGGSGAKFLVQWRSERPISPPIIESVMIGTGGQQGISFTSRGVAISETP